jgi:RNA polymerase sigma-70 factor (ECF subfamily)
MSVVYLDFSPSVGQDRPQAGNHSAQAIGHDLERDLSKEHLAVLLMAVGRHRDREAFGQLYEYYVPRLKSFGMRQGVGPAKAEELAQETMLVVWRKAESFDPKKGSPSNWVFTVMRNKRIDMFRRQRHPEYELDESVEVVDPDPHPDAAVGQTQENELLRKAVKLLPENQIEVIEKAFFEDMSHGQVAESLGLPLGTVKSRIRLAMQRLRVLMEEDQ